MKVLKFGGSSVGSVNSILSVKKIVEAVEEPVIVVVSALGGITDKLIHTSEMAANGDASYEKEYRDILNRHIEMVYMCFYVIHAYGCKQQSNQFIFYFKIQRVVQEMNART